MECEVSILESFVKSLHKILKAITNLFGTIAGFLILCIAFMITYEVIVRAAFNAPTEWVTEISTYFLSIGGFLGMGVAYAGKKHIRVDIFLTKMSHKTQTYLSLITSLLGAFYAFLFAMKGLDMALLSLELDNRAPTTLSSPLWIPQMSMPLGLGLLALLLLETFLIDIVRIQKNDYEWEVK